MEYVVSVVLLDLSFSERVQWHDALYTLALILGTAQGTSCLSHRVRSGHSVYIGQVMCGAQ
eukprot:3752267-Amphidinium_carterae.1